MAVGVGVGVGVVGVSLESPHPVIVIATPLRRANAEETVKSRRVSFFESIMAVSFRE